MLKSFLLNKMQNDDIIHQDITFSLIYGRIGTKIILRMTNIIIFICYYDYYYYYHQVLSLVTRDAPIQFVEPKFLLTIITNDRVC